MSVVEYAIMTNIAAIIKDRNEMEWKSPNNEYTFKMKRYDNILPFRTEGCNYCIEIEIYNNINILVYKFRFNEMDCIRILDCIGFFAADCEYQSGSSVLIGLNSYDNTIGDFTDLYFYRDVENVTSFDANDIMRDIKLVISRTNNINKADLVTIYMSDDELTDFAYAIYFMGVIDLPLNETDEYTVSNSIRKIFHEEYI